MKINPYRHLENQPFQRQVPKKDQVATTKQTDKVEISSEAKKMQQIPSIVIEREQRVAELKNQVQNGEYKVDPKKVAEGMAKFFGL